MRQLFVPRRRSLSHYPADRSLIGQFAKRFDPGHEWFAFGKRFRTAAAREMEAMTILSQLVQKGINKSSLSQPCISGNAGNAAVTFQGSFVGPTQLCRLRL